MASRRPLDPQSDGLLGALEEALGADRVATDEASRRAYATDASPCVVDPWGVVFARSEGGGLAPWRARRRRAGWGGGVSPPPPRGIYDLCRIGGMIGHNASGYRSVK